MIIFLSTPRHRYTLARFKAEHGFPVPAKRSMPYHRLFRSLLVPRATYVFTDLDRLSPWELRVAADYYRILQDAGMRCLNDPARVLSRYELLAALHREGINPQAVYRAEDHPRPAGFPVFVRLEDHGKPVSPLLNSQEDLDAALGDLRGRGIPLRGALVLEFCSQEYSPGLWNKWGAFRVGDRYSLDHIAVEKEWLVKYGDWYLLSDPVIADEHNAVFANRYVDHLERIFELAGIEYGRADFQVIDGRPVIYEINTNPYIPKFVPDPKPVRLETQMLARTRVAEAFAAIDTPGRGHVRITPSALIKLRRGFVPGFLPFQQP